MDFLVKPKDALFGKVILITGASPDPPIGTRTSGLSGSFDFAKIKSLLISKVKGS